MPTGEAVHFDPRDAWDVVYNPSAPDVHWSTSNIGEALPGVPTPLSWSLWDVMEGASREAAYAIGALTRAERHTPAAVDERDLSASSTDVPPFRRDRRQQRRGGRTGDRLGVDGGRGRVEIVERAALSGTATEARCEREE
jgi:hypothetical protein